jgi:hypothetical protein
VVNIIIVVMVMVDMPWIVIIPLYFDGVFFLFPSCSSPFSPADVIIFIITLILLLLPLLH